MEERDQQLRRVQVGSRARNEKLRTYNYQQNRVTDHRLPASSSSSSSSTDTGADAQQQQSSSAELDGRTLTDSSLGRHPSPLLTPEQLDVLLRAVRRLTRSDRLAHIVQSEAALLTRALASGAAASASR